MKNIDCSVRKPTFLVNFTSFLALKWSKFMGFVWKSNQFLPLALEMQFQSLTTFGWKTVSKLCGNPYGHTDRRRTDRRTYASVTIVWLRFVWRFMCDWSHKQLSHTKYLCDYFLPTHDKCLCDTKFNVTVHICVTGLYNGLASVFFKF